MRLGIVIRVVVVGSVWALISGIQGAGAEEVSPAQAARPEVTSFPQIPDSLHHALQSREFAKAAELIDDLVADPQQKHADYLLYLKGTAQSQQGQLDAALDTFVLLEKTYPRSAWLSRSRFGRGAVLSRQRNYQAAAAIYKAESERLLSNGRRDELTGIYLEFADRFFEGEPEKGPTPRKEPDYNQALSFYTQALVLKPSRPVRQKIELRIARCHQELNQLPQAMEAYRQFLSAYTGRKLAEADKLPAALEVDATFQLGRAQLAAGQPAEARKTWNDFLGSAAAREAGGPWNAQAAYQLAHTYGIPTPATVGDLELGVAAMEKFLKSFPKHELAAQAEFEIAQSYAHHARMDQAVSTLKKLIANPDYARSRHVPAAWNLLGQSYAAQKKYTEAIEAWHAFLDKFPTDPGWSAVQQVIVDTEFAMAQEERTRENFAGARKLWETFLNKYPLDGRAPSIWLLFGQMEFDEAVKLQEAGSKTAAAVTPVDNGPAAQAAVNDKAPAKAADATKNSEAARKLFEAAITDWQRLVSKYPASAEASQGALNIGTTLELRLGKLPEALEAYQKVQGPQQAAAQQRIAALTAKQLEVVTERKFRSNEKPRIRLTTRNLETVSVKMYRVDLTDYFRKMHLATGVEALDIALIDPDKTWDHKVQQFEKYRQLDQSVEIPVEGPGVTAVTVASDTLEATTMIVVSDIDIIVKSSRNELFVFAQNLLTNQAAAGVNLLISDGNQVFAEAVTGPDGILQRKYSELKAATDLRVFAALEGHSASSQINLNGLQFAVGLSPKGYLYTDRPAYRAGQLVNLKGIVRWVANDRYVFKAGEKYQLDVYDARGRVVHTSAIELGEFGTVAAHFVLPGTAPQGVCRVHLHQPGRDQAYETSFLVREYQLEPIQFSVDLKEKVVHRGEHLTGKITLKYYYGTPLAGRTIQYRLGDDRLYTAETDERGEVAFDLETQRFSESQAVALMAHFPERNLTAGETAYVATRGFEIGLTTLRSVYISGETFDVTALVRDPAGKTVETPLKLEVLESLPPRRGLPAGERLVQTLSGRSDAAAGQYRQTVRIEQPGRYLLRATGTDRFGNPVSGTTTIVVSGDDDRVRLRILADKHHFKVGETGRIQLHWRNAPALALVTFEGAEVLAYRLVKLQTGANALELPIDEKLAPNFDLAVSVMEPDRFHETRSEFRVARELIIALKPEKTALKPGEIANVSVQVTDANGKPVSAEISVALIQKNLLAAFPDQSSAIDAFFNGGLRQVSVRATTSCVFRYAPPTRPINLFLLAEEERKKILELEAAARLGTPQLAEERPARNLRGAVSGKRQWAAIAANSAAPEGRELSSMNDAIVLHGGDDDLVADAAEVDTSSGVVANTPFFEDLPGNGVMFGGTTAGKKFYKNSRALGRTKNRRRFALPAPNGTAAADFKAENAVSDEAESLSLQILQTWDDSSADGEADLYARGDWGRNFLTANMPWAKDLNLNSAANYAGQTFQLNRHDANFQSGLASLSRQSAGTVLALNAWGEFQVVNGLPVVRLQQIAREGLEIVPALSAVETAYWNPRVVTDADGRATLAIRVPDRSTAWKLLSRGVNRETLAGTGEAEMVTRKDLFGEMKLPTAFTAGDRAQVLVEIHNAAMEQGTISVRFKTTIGDKTTELQKQIAVKKIGIEELSFPVEITAGEAAQFELSVASGDTRDTSTQVIPVLAYGAPVYATASGTSGQNTSLTIQHPAGLAVENLQLELLIGPSVNRTLLDAVIGSTSSLSERAALHSLQLGSELERAISDTIGGVALLKMIGASRTAGTPEAQALAGKIAAAVSQLVSSQRDDGGWGWAGQPAGERSDRYISSRAVWALAAARSAGFAVPSAILDKAVQNLNTLFTSAAESDNEGKVIILHGLAEAGSADFAQANRLHRNRNALSPAGLVHLALVFIKLDRQDFAKDLLAIARQKISTKPKLPAAADEALKGCVPWMQSGVELRSLYLLALNAVEPAGALNGELAEWLMKARQGTRWSPEKANGPAIAATADWYGRAKLVNEKYTLTIFANDRQVEKLTIDPATAPTRVVQIPAKFLLAGQPQRINLDLEGRGTFSYSASLAGFVPADKLQGTTKDWHFQRFYEPAARLLDGETIPRGFGVLTGNYQAFRNPLTQLPLGERGEVSIHLWRDRVTGAKDEQLDYLIYTEPIPAGTSVLPETITGTFDRYELTPGAITFYLGDRAHLGSIQFSVVGYLPGQFKNVPSILRSFYQPERIAVAKDLPLEVLARGQKSQDAYKQTPQELYEYGKRLAARGDWNAAATHLRSLFKDYQLQDNIYREVVQLLFNSAVAADNHAEIVQFFEIIKEKYPDAEVSFEDILKVAQAYAELGEYERSYLVYRATAEGNFLRESQIAGFLDQRGEFLRSVQVMERLLGEYPAESYIATATYALSQEIYGKAPEASSHPKLREAKVTRVDLIAASIRILDHFLSTWATDPAADQASFALANALLDLEQYDTAIKRCTTFAQRYPQSQLLDSFWYVIGFSQFSIGNSDAALDMCRKVAEFKRKDPNTGIEIAAANQFQAIYILGQVYHSLGKPAEAIAEYGRVKDRFADANEAIEFFTHKALALPEVTTVKPGAAAKVALKFRNVPNANIKVYRIDLLKFGLLQRNLARITGINLAGIRPYHDSAVNLGDGKDYRDREHELELPLKDEGAYLVVCQGDNLYASGLVLVSPLALEVQEDAASGRVRVTVKDVLAEKYVHNVHVKVIGSSNDQFISGQSDLRGIFVADGILGTSTVIARTDANRYAFFRGKLPLGNVQPKAPAAAAEGKPAAGNEPSQGKGDLLKNLQLQNGYFNNDNRANYRNLLQNSTQGVKAKGAF
ncbi:MAG: tetratricopeptide repeat protein [Planctomycetes bacterium]|nr:tetratricopeptide repeat protein [Planctomycetota bacterium]